MNQLNAHRSGKQTPAGGGKSAVNHSHVHNYLRTHTLDTKIRREMDTRAHTHTQTLIRMEINQSAGDRRQCDRERWREKEGVREVKEYIKALGVQGAVGEENVTETPSHSDTFKEAEVARGKCILTQWVDNMARCVERAGQAEVTLIDIIHTRTERESKWSIQ